MAGVFGNDFRLQRENERLKRELAREKADNLDLQHENASLKEMSAQWKAYGQNLGAYGQLINDKLQCLREQVHSLADSQERNFSNMASREEFDAAKQQLMQAVSDAANRVSTDIQALRDQLASGAQITDQDLADVQADIQGVGAIDPANPTPPASRKK